MRGMRLFFGQARCSTCHKGPNLSDVLNDSIVMAVIRADGVSPDELARVLEILVCRALSRSARPRRGEET